jgi:hypothetical protein
MGNWENMLPLVDAWLDGQDAPPSDGPDRERRPGQAGAKSWSRRKVR